MREGISNTAGTRDGEGEEVMKDTTFGNQLKSFQRVVSNTKISHRITQMKHAVQCQDYEHDVNVL